MSNDQQQTGHSEVDPTFRDCECGHSMLAHSPGSSGCNGSVDLPGGAWGKCSCEVRSASGNGS